MSIKKIKPDLKLNQYPLQNAEVKFKHFDINKLKSVNFEDKRIKDFLIRNIPEFDLYISIIFKYYDFKDLRDYISFYIDLKKNKDNSNTEERYKNNQEIKKIPLDLSKRQKNK